MTWTSVRLELARTPEFPEGSAAHAFLLHLPLGADGRIEPHVLAANPARAIVRRAWPGEPDMSGYVIASGQGWALSYRPGEEDDEPIFHLADHAIRRGEYLTLTKPDGQSLPFRIASLSALA